VRPEQNPPIGIEEESERPYRRPLGSTGITGESTRPPLSLRMKCSSMLHRASLLSHPTSLAVVFGGQDAPILLLQRQPWGWHCLASGLMRAEQSSPSPVLNPEWFPTPVVPPMLVSIDLNFPVGVGAPHPVRLNSNQLNRANPTCDPRSPPSFLSLSSCANWRLAKQAASQER